MGGVIKGVQHTGPEMGLAPAINRLEALVQLRVCCQRVAEIVKIRSK